VRVAAERRRKQTYHSRTTLADRDRCLDRIYITGCGRLIYIVSFGVLDEGRQYNSELLQDTRLRQSFKHPVYNTHRPVVEFCTVLASCKGRLVDVLSVSSSLKHWQYPAYTRNWDGLCPERPCERTGGSATEVDGLLRYGSAGLFSVPPERTVRLLVALSTPQRTAARD
jgi:hypothetical protein